MQRLQCNVLRFHNGFDVVYPLLLVACLVTLLIVNSRAIFWTGLAGSMRSKRHYRAGLLAFAVIVGAPVLLFGLVLWGSSRSWGNLEGLLVFTILSLVNSWIFSSGARQRFQSDLRQAEVNGLIGSIPSFNSVLRYTGESELEQTLTQLVELEPSHQEARGLLEEAESHLALQRRKNLRLAKLASAALRRSRSRRQSRHCDK